MPNKSQVRKPTPAESAKMERARQRLQEAQREERGTINKMIPTMGKAARDQAKAAQAEMESVPKSVRDYEDMAASEVQYPDDGTTPVKKSKGGMVTARGQGCVMRKKVTRMR